MPSRKEDVTGKVFGRLTVICFDRIQNGKTFWKCQCSCGVIKSMRIDAMKRGVVSCGCATIEAARQHEDLTKRRFGKLVVIEKSDIRKVSKFIYWNCRCDCGQICTVQGRNLTIGKTQSCGCRHRSIAKAQALLMGKANKTHGMHASKEYEKWHGIKQRCDGTSNEKSNNYYHGKGIRYCDRWKYFENFLEDMGRLPSPRHQIDRIDYKGDYCKENCRWVLPQEQQRNKSTNVVIEYQGTRCCLVEWAEKLNIDYFVLRNRIRSGWSVEEAFTTSSLHKFKGTRPKSPLPAKLKGLIQ